MRNLVTGGSGFIGHQIVKQLVERGETVRVLDIQQPQDLPGAIEFVQGSITDQAIVSKVTQNIDAVFHVAANAFLWARNKHVFENVNHQGTKNIVQGALNAGVQRLVHTSSLTISVGTATSRRLHKVDETVQPPLSDLLGPYPRSKWLAEAAVRQGVGSGLDAVIVIPTLPIGPGDHNLTGPTRMILDYLSGKTPAFLETRMNFVDVRDLAAAHIAARDQGTSGERYFACGDNMWLSQFLESLSDVSARSMPQTRVPFWLAHTVALVDEWIADTFSRKPPTAPLTGVRLAGYPIDFDNTKASNELGFRYRPLKDSLRDQINWFEQNDLIPTKES